MIQLGFTCRQVEEKETPPVHKKTRPAEPPTRRAANAPSPSSPERRPDSVAKMLSATPARFEFSPRGYTDIWPLRTGSPSLNKDQGKGVAVPWESDEWRKIKKQPEVDGIKRWMKGNPELVRQMEKRNAQAAAPAPSPPRQPRSPAKLPASSPRSARQQQHAPRRVVTAQSSQQLSRLIDAQHGFRPRYGVAPSASSSRAYFPPVAAHRGNPYRDTGIRVPATFRPSTSSGKPYGA